MRREMFWNVLMLAAAAAVSACTGTGTPLSSPESAGRRAIEAAMQVDRIPAMSIAVISDGTLAWSEATGTANLETGEPATLQSRFRLGSVAKVLSADLAAVLAREGAVDLDADIRTYVPAFPDKGEVITLRQLLGHLGGVRHYVDGDFDFTAPGGVIDWRVYPDADSILALFAGDPLVAAPGEEFNYTTFGYSLIGLALEGATGERYFELLNEKILGPASIQGIAVDDMFMIVPGRVEFYDPVADYEDLLPAETYGPVINAAHLNSAYKIPGGGLVGTAEAVARFGALHLPGGLLPESALPELFAVQKTRAGAETGMALGWHVSRDGKGRRLFSHSGSQQGCRAFLAVYPDDSLVVAVLSNMGGLPDDIASLSERIAEAFLADAAQPSGAARK
jgi:CubicO group peptidase (beta-lactamase class C family)